MTHPGDGPDPVERGRRLRAAGDLRGALEAFGDALAARSDDPELLFETAGLLRALEMNEEALGLYEALAAALPDLLPVLHNRASCLVDLGRGAEAVERFAAILARWPDATPCWAGLGDAAFAAGAEGLAVRAYRVALALDPQRTGSYVNLGEELAGTGDDDAAVPVLHRAAALAPEDPTIRFNLAMSLLPLGRHAEGWAAYEGRLEPGLPNSVARRFACPRWDGGPLAGRHLFVAGEAGIGDQIWFLPFVREAAAQAGRVTVEVTAKLIPLAAAALPGVTVRPLEVERQDGRWQATGASRAAPPDADAFIELGSLPRFLWEPARRHAATPVLRPDPARRARWRARLEALGPGPYVGLCWRSAVRHGRGREYRPVEEWEPMLTAAGPARFVCLQQDATAEELAWLHGTAGAPVAVLPDLDLRDSLEDALALVASLDLLVSAPTWISRLGGAAGVPTLVVGNLRWVGPVAGHDPVHHALEPIYPGQGRPWPAGVIAEAAARLTTALRHPASTHAGEQP